MSQGNDHINDVEFVEDEDFSGEASIDQKLKKLRQKLKQCEAEKGENLSGWQRAKADLVNAKKELQNDRPRLMLMGKVALIEDLLPVMDSFSMAIGNNDAWQAVDEKWRVGVEYIFNQLKTALEQHGVKEISPAPGDDVDHDLHDVVGHDPNHSDQEKIVSIRRKGYQLDGRIIRPAEIIVGEE